MVVRIADGKTVPILGVGDVGPLTNVFHVPSLVYDLISESQLDKEGKYLECHGGVRTMRDSRDGPVFFRAHMNTGGLYIVEPRYIDIDGYEYDTSSFIALQTKAEAIDILHKVLGHVHVEHIQEMVKEKRLTWSHESAPVNLKKYSTPCVAGM